MLVLLSTKPALWFFTVLTILAWDSIDWDPNMKDIPPSLARAMASSVPETACIIADVIGMFMLIAGSSPFLNFVTGVFSETFSTLLSADEYPGTSRYSLNVLDGSSKYFAIISALFMGLYPGLSALNIMGLHSPQSAVLSAIIYNALIIIALIPLALKGVKYREVPAGKLLSRNLLIYGLGGLAAPFIFIKLIDLIFVLFGLA